MGWATVSSVERAWQGGRAPKARDPIRAARWRLTLRFALMVAVLLLTAGAAVYAYTQHKLLDAFDAAHDLALNSALESVVVSGAAIRVDRREFSEEFEELNDSLGVVGMALFGAGGERLAQAGDSALSAVGPERELRDEGPRAVVVRRRAFGDGAGIVVVSRRAGDIARDLALLRGGLFTIIPLVLLAACGVGWVMAGLSLRPVQRAFERQRAFMADTSHELRTPLAIIRAHAEVQQGGDATAQQTALSVIAKTAAELSGVLDDLMFLARTDAAALAPRRVRFSLDEMIDELVLAFAPRAEEKGSRLLHDTAAGLEVEADPAQLQRLFALLLDNALRHADPGDIEIDVRRLGAVVELRVADGGPGIAPELLPRVFERFVRGPSPQGLGLGLSIAESIVHAHRGTIQLQTNERGGLTAVVRLPQP